jgi:putative sterol carrier protein
MANEELLEGIKKMTIKLEEPAYKERFKGFKKVLQFEFDDTDNYYLVFDEDKCDIKEGEVDDWDIRIKTTSEVIIDIMDGELSPTKAFMSGKIKAKGPMKDMLKLQMLMK